MLSRFFMGWAADKDPEEAANALDELLDEPENEQQEDADPASVSPAPAAAPAAPVAQQNDSPELIALLKQVLAKAFLLKLLLLKLYQILVLMLLEI